MAGSGAGRVFGGGCYGGGVGPSLLFPPPHSPQPFLISGSSYSPFFGSGSSSIMGFEYICGGKRSERPFFSTLYDQDENGDDDFEDYFHQPEKKRRLTVDQVRFLEKSFEVENKLEPDRKAQLAKDLGLQPRQVAIWFQNRRARWKTKQLEKDFDCLQSSYNSLKAHFDSLLQEKQKLQAEVVHLTDKLVLKDKTHQGEDQFSEPSNTYVEPKPVQDEPSSETEDPEVWMFGSKQEDLSSAKSDVIDSESPHCVADVSHSAFGNPADHSDISQDDEDYLIKSLLPSSCVFVKIGDVGYPNPPAANSCNYGLHGEDHASVLWPCWDINLKM